MIESEFIHLRPAFRHSPIDGVKLLSFWLKSNLSQLGYLVEPIQEDWGYWLAVEKRDAKMAIGVYGVGESAADWEFAITVFTDKARKWVVWPFLARSIEAEIRELKQDLSHVLTQSTDLIVVGRTRDYPL